MAAKFNIIQNPSIDSELRPSTPDLPLGGRNTAILGGRNTSQSLYYVNFITSNLPSYGSGTVYGDQTAKPRLDLYLLDTKASVEGSLASATGDTTLDQDYLVYSYCTNSNHCNIEETMSNLNYEVDYNRNDGTGIIKREGPYMHIFEIARYAMGWDPLHTEYYGVAYRGENDNPFSDVLGYMIAYDNGTGQWYVRDKHEEQGGAHAEQHKHPTGRMYLNNDLWIDNETYPEYNIVRWTHETLLKTDITEVQTITADAGSTTIFNNFETTRQFVFKDGGSGDSSAVPTEAADIEGFTATIVKTKLKQVLKL